MRLFIDGQPLQNANSRDSGIGRYTNNLLCALCDSPENHDITLALRTDLLPWNPSNPKIKLAHYTPAFPNPTGLNHEHMQCEKHYANWIQSFSPDAYINTDNMNPWFLVPRFGTKKPITAAIYYDLIPLIFPDIYLYDNNALNFHAIRLRSLIRNDLILSISDQSSRDLKHLFPETKDKLITIHGAMDHYFSDENNTPSPSVWDSLKSRLNLDKPYFFHVGRWEPRKNLEGAIEAFGCFNLKHPGKFNLVLNCTLKPEQDATLRQLSSQFKVESQIRFTGRTNDEELKLLYQNARLLFFPSFYEGLGLPILESLASGTPVAVSNTSSMPEFAGPDAGLFDPSNPEDMAQCLDKMLAVPKEQTCESGKKFARSFTWENSASKALCAIQSLLQSPRKAKKSCCLIRLWPILQPSDNNLVKQTIKQFQNDFSVQHFVSDSEIYFDAEISHQAPIHSIAYIDSFLREDPSMVMIFWPRSQDELSIIKTFDCEEKHLVIDGVNKNLFFSGKSFENRNKLSEATFENYKGFFEVSLEDSGVKIHSKFTN